MADYIPITQWAEDDRPREKLLLKGREALSDAELIAILLGSGTAKRSAVDLAKDILQKANNNLYELARLSIKDLCTIKGIGEAKAITLISALELGRRRKDAEPAKRPQIRGARDVYEMMRPHLADLPHEEFWVLLLNRANMVTRKHRLSIGGVAGTVADPKLIFKLALEELASGIILIHNHPSGNCSPSQADHDITQKVASGAKYLDMRLLDHLIYTDNNGYYSFADEGSL